MFIKKSVKIFVLVVMVLAMSGFTYAFAATNTVPATNAGDGAEDISGYVITDVTYTLAADPTTIASVSFTISPSAGFVTIRLVDGSASWYSCNTGTAITCTTNGATVLAADLLQVVATD